MSSDDVPERSVDRFRVDGAGDRPADRGSDADRRATAADVGATGAAVAEPAGSDGDAVPMPDEPIGTFFFMIVFILLLVGLWSTVFWMLLNR